MAYRVIVIGLSAGGMQPLLKITAALPADLNAAVLVVQHIPAHAKSQLAAVIGQRAQMRVKNAEHGEALRPGTIYTAVSDRHLLVDEDRRILIARGPKENRFRPSVDALFRSAAYNCGASTIGVVLSGALNDGASGMYTIDRLGGATIVQDPKEATFADMPRSVMEYVAVQHVAPTREIPHILAKLCDETSEDSDNPANMTKKERDLLALEYAIARGEDALGGGILQHGMYTPLTCPECHGALTQIASDPIVRYRCHTGHAHTAETLLTGIDDGIETSMWEAMRGMEEGTILLRALAEHLDRQGQIDRASSMRTRAERLKVQSQQMKGFITEADISTEEVIS